MYGAPGVNAVPTRLFTRVQDLSALLVHLQRSCRGIVGRLLKEYEITLNLGGIEGIEVTAFPNGGGFGANVEIVMPPDESSRIEIKLRHKADGGQVSIFFSSIPSPTLKCGMCSLHLGWADFPSSLAINPHPPSPLVHSPTIMMSPENSV